MACFSSAQDVLQITRDRLGALGVLRYAPDHMLIDIVYSATILLKVSTTPKVKPIPLNKPS